jgi:hypothetical protein
MIYVFAIAVALLAAGLALLLPVWLRGGRSAVVRESGRIVPTLAIILVMLLAIAWATSFQLGGLVNVVLALASTAVAAWWLVRGGFRGSEGSWMRSLLLLALIVSIVVLVLSDQSVPANCIVPATDALFPLLPIRCLPDWSGTGAETARNSIFFNADEVIPLIKAAEETAPIEQVGGTLAFMGLALRVQLRYADGEVLARDSQHSFELAALMPAISDMDFPLLRLVDPYGETIFSRHQMLGVIPELDRLALKDTAGVLVKVREFASRCRETPHAFLVLIGD